MASSGQRPAKRIEKNALKASGSRAEKGIIGDS
jgi:hypothetical protein